MVAILKIVLPIVVAFSTGIICRKKEIIDEEGNRQVKHLLQEVAIPLVLFNALLSAEITIKSLLLSLTVLAAMLLVYFLAIFFSRFYIKEYRKYFPEMMVSWEGGTLGISLCSLLFGPFGLSTMAIMDFGAAIMLFGIMVPVLRVKDGAKCSAKEILKLIFTTKPFVGILLGVILSALGVGKFIFGNVLLNTIYHGIVDIIISPINFLIMLTIGFGLKFNKSLLKPVITTCICRVIFMSLALIFSIFVVFKFMPFDKKILLILATAFYLPESFALPIFSDLGDREYLSTTLSFMTIVCLIIFTVISALSTTI